MVVGVDGSPESLNAETWAARLAQHFDAEVLAVHALTLGRELVLDIPTLGVTDWRRDLRASLYGAWTEPLRAAGVRHRVLLVEKHAGDAILEVAARGPADMIVLGTRPRGRRGQRAVGELVSHLCREAPCPVVAVPLVGRERNH